MFISCCAKFMERSANFSPPLSLFTSECQASQVCMIFFLGGSFSLSTRSVGVDKRARFTSYFTFSISLHEPFSVSMHGTSSPPPPPPWGISLECRLAPATLQSMVPPRLKSIEHVDDIFLGTCPTVTPDFTTATAKGSRWLPFEPRYFLYGRGNGAYHPRPQNGRIHSNARRFSQEAC